MARGLPTAPFCLFALVYLAGWGPAFVTQRSPSPPPRLVKASFLLLRRAPPLPTLYLPGLWADRLGSWFNHCLPAVWP